MSVVDVDKMSGRYDVCGVLVYAGGGDLHYRSWLRFSGLLSRHFGAMKDMARCLPI
jgi:hypothetical protein